MYSFSYLEPVCCSMSCSNGCFLTSIQVSQEAGQVVWCWEPAWGIPPVTRSCGRDLMCKVESDLRFSPWYFLSIHPPRPESACFTMLCFPSTFLTLTGGCPPTTFFWKKLELLDNKSPGHNTSVSIQKPLWWLFSLPAGLVQLRLWLFEASWLQEALEA